MFTAAARSTARTIIRHASPVIVRSTAGVRPAFFIQQSPIIGGHRNVGSHMGEPDGHDMGKVTRTAYDYVMRHHKLYYQPDHEVDELMNKIGEAIDHLYGEVKETESDQEEVFGKQVDISDQQRTEELGLDDDDHASGDEGSGRTPIPDRTEPKAGRECLRSEGYFGATTPRLDPSTNQIERVRTIDILFTGAVKHTSVVTQVVRNHWWATRVLPMMYLASYPKLVVQAVEQTRAKQPGCNIYEDWMVRARVDDGLHVTIDDVFMAIATLPSESATRKLLEEHFKHHADVLDYTDLLGEQKETLRLKTMQSTSRAVCDAVHAIFKETSQSVE
ncbi:hypothetical protein FN846DRAFT_911214 [Sphaerosporella brunnea]|uniref:Uncharacterized protein n=1 Tax=Sphaerosporella brunnea TaxID=1250544 RepID=A0A5J5EKH8_9PEZI|nr:hypothetical protein FN846DRAFT_911214 [Sphaerosporella brunnea]